MRRPRRLEDGPGPAAHLPLPARPWPPNERRALAAFASARFGAQERARPGLAQRAGGLRRALRRWGARPPGMGSRGGVSPPGPGLTSAPGAGTVKLGWVGRIRRGNWAGVRNYLARLWGGIFGGVTNSLSGGERGSLCACLGHLFLQVLDLQVRLFFFFFLLIQLGLTFWGTRGEHLAMLRDSFLWGAWCPGEHVCLGLNPEPLESFSTLGFGLAFPLKETS